MCYVRLKKILQVRSFYVLCEIEKGIIIDKHLFHFAEDNRGTLYYRYRIQ